MALHVAILAAGMGTRLGKPHPKSLTPLDNGQTILERQLALIRGTFGEDTHIHIVVGFKLELILEAAPDVLFVYNEIFDQTNTSKSLLKAVRLAGSEGLLWMNGDVVFEPEVLDVLRKHVAADTSFIAVNTASVAEEEIKYTLDEHGHIDQLSKQVQNALGEAVGINYVSSADVPTLIKRLDQCALQDYFERGIEYTISEDSTAWIVVDVSAYNCVEVDFADDLEQANLMMARVSAGGRPTG